MKKLLALALVFGAAAQFAFGDIQDPPGNDYGPTRKLGRGLANMFIPTEIPDSIARVNKYEGNNAAATYGVLRGVGRTVERNWVGLFEVLTFPFPVWRQGYQPILPSNIHWKHTGFAEFPPELGNETKYIYVRDY